jgi:hypothetical protein
MPYYDLQETIDKFKAIAESYGVKLLDQKPSFFEPEKQKSICFQLHDSFDKSNHTGFIVISHRYSEEQKEEITDFDFHTKICGSGLWITDNSMKNIERMFLDCFRCFNFDIPVKVHHVPKIEQLSLFEV